MPVLFLQKENLDVFLVPMPAFTDHRGVYTDHRLWHGGLAASTGTDRKNSVDIHHRLRRILIFFLFLKFIKKSKNIYS
jgi:hypothetical protein